MFSGDRDRNLLDFLTWMGYRYFLGLVGFPVLFGPLLGCVPFVYSRCTFGQLSCIFL